ncbi:hypothetical protein T09_1254 [Trichinella sp. T9]|nr:hypothetical protein T09_1254 [Trichinella sp. T9]
MLIHVKVEEEEEEEEEEEINKSINSYSTPMNERLTRLPRAILRYVNTVGFLEKSSSQLNCNAHRQLPTTCQLKKHNNNFVISSETAEMETFKKPTCLPSVIRSAQNIFEQSLLPCEFGT